MYVLKDLWRGKITPIERYIRPESDYRRASTEICKRIDCFLENLSPEEKKQLEVIDDLRSEMAMMAEEDAFIRGFRLGARMVLDVVGEYRGQFMEPGE